MIICNGELMRELERQAKLARAGLPKSEAFAADRHMELADSDGDLWLATLTIARGFGVSKQTYKNRVNSNRDTFQGHLLVLDPNKGPLFYGTVLLAVLTNKATLIYLPWDTPEKAQKALALSRQIERYQARSNSNGQYRIDNWKVKANG